MAQFEQAFEYILQNEGKTYTNDIKDQGGPTKFGITLATLNGYMKFAVSADVKDLTVEKARDVYLKMFWEPLKCDEITSQEVATALFDIGINTGIKNGVRLAQKALVTPVDGVMGPETLGYLNEVERRLFLSNFIPAVQNYYINIAVGDSNNVRFLAGWLKRSQRLIKLMV